MTDNEPIDLADEPTTNYPQLPPTDDDEPIDLADEPK